MRDARQHTRPRDVPCVTILETSRERRLHKSHQLDMSNLIITSGSDTWRKESWRSGRRRPGDLQSVCKKFSYADVKIREIGPRTALAARLAKQRRQLSLQMMGRNTPTMCVSLAGFSSASWSIAVEGIWNAFAEWNFWFRNLNRTPLNFLKASSQVNNFTGE